MVHLILPYDLGRRLFDTAWISFAEVYDIGLQQRSFAKQICRLKHNQPSTVLWSTLNKDLTDHWRYPAYATCNSLSVELMKSSHTYLTAVPSCCCVVSTSEVIRINLSSHNTESVLLVLLLLELSTNKHHLIEIYK